MAVSSENIAMVCDFFHPNVGGVENHIYSLSVELMKRGHKVIVITHSYPPSRVGIRWLVPGLKVYYIPLPVLVSGATLPNFLTFLPWVRPILLREHITLIHGHAALSSFAHEAIFHSQLFGIRTVFTDHSLFALDDATGILTNKLLAAVLRNVGAVICVSHTGRENTTLRAELDPNIVHVIPNAIISQQFKPSNIAPPKDKIVIVVVSRLAYRKGTDLLAAAAPKICARFPQVHFVVGGDGPKMIELLQMREKHQLQDRIELLGAVDHNKVIDVLHRGSIYLNTSLTEAFCIGLIEAASAGLYPVSTRVGGVPEVLPPDMITFAYPNEDDVVRALADAIKLVASGVHDPLKAHERIKAMYNWDDVAERTERVYAGIPPPVSLWVRLQRTLNLGLFAGPIFSIILAVECFFYLFLEWLNPREDIDFVKEDWPMDGLHKVCALC